jgi:hypothetical protein
MGLKQWLGKNVAGVGAYGGSIGRSVAGNGLALGRTLYLGHGKTHRTPNCSFFDSPQAMAAAGYAVYCDDPSRMPPNEDSSELSLLTRAAGIAFAARVAMNASEYFASPDNRSTFRKAIGASTAAYLAEGGRGLSIDLVTHFVRLDAPRGITQVLDLKSPGSNDLFGVLLKEVSERSREASIGFQRGGILGYSAVVGPLATETTSAVQRAAQEFGW